MQVYDPQEDSFLLRDIILKEDLCGKKCLDLGTGSGIQAKAMLDQGAKQVFCVDINPKALLVAQNLLKNYANKFVLINSDLFDSLIGEKFDFIVFNPPYVPSKDIKWVDLDGGKKGRLVIDSFLDCFVNHLSVGAKVFLLISSLNDKTDIISVLESKNFFVEVIASKKLFFEELFVLSIKQK